MTLLTRPDTARPDRHASPAEPRPAGLGLGRVFEIGSAGFAGAVCVLLGAMLIAIPTLLAWVADERSTVSLWQALGASVDVWALAHRAAVQTPDFTLVFAPLLLTAIPFALCWYAARHVVLSRGEVTGRVARVANIRGWKSAWRGIGATDAVAFVLGYLLAALLLAHTASFGLAPVWLPSLVPGAVLVPLLAVLITWWREHRREEHPSVDVALTWLADRTPAVFRRAVRPAVHVFVGLTVVSLLVVLALLILRGERILTLYSALDAGLVGTTVLSLGQLAALPNLMVWALGWLTGAGLSVGTVHVGWAETTPGDLPLIPMLGALPEPGALPPGLWVVALAPVLLGCWLGFRCTWALPRLTTWMTKALIVITAATYVSLSVLVLGWLASGGITPGLLGTVGVVPWRVAFLLLLQTAAPGLVVMSVLHLFRRRL